jgi:hypothetical protein
MMEGIMARPKIILSMDMLEIAQRFYSRGHVNSTVADALGVSRRTYDGWLRRGRDSIEAGATCDHDISCELLLQARLSGRNVAKTALLSTVYRSAAAGDWRAARYGLRVLDPENYMEEVLLHKHTREAESEESPVTPEQINPQLSPPPPIVKPDDRD